MFNTATISRLANGDRLPIILSMTCSDGYWILPPNVPGFPSSLAEELLRAPNKGAIATFSPSGYDDVYGHDKLQRRFMTSLIEIPRYQHWRAYHGSPPAGVYRRDQFRTDPPIHLVLATRPSG